MRLRGSDSEDWVAAGLGLARLVPGGEDVTARSGTWVLEAMAERLDLPPLGVVVDMGALLLGATLEWLRLPSAAPEYDRELVSMMRRYEDAVLGRLAADPRLVQAGFAVARLAPEMHPDAVGLLVGSILTRIGYDAGVEVEPGVVRNLTAKTPRETAERGARVLRDRADVRASLAAGYAGLVRRAQRTRDLIGDAELFALENLTVFGSLGQRLAIADVLHAEEVLFEALPRRFPRKRRDVGSVATALDDESAYPVGGFSSLSTSGTIENLVTSELIYMNPPGSREAIDLFDMRYVEGELLYYTRDETILVRRRRQIVFALEPSLVRARVKDAVLPWQRIVVVLAVLLTVTKKLVELLGAEDLQIRVVFVVDEGKSPLAEEHALLELLLGEWRGKGIVSTEVASWERIEAATTAAAQSAHVDIVRIAAAGEGAAPHAFHPSVGRMELPVGEATTEAWCAATVALMTSIL